MRARDIRDFPDLAWTGVLFVLSLMAVIGWKSGASISGATLAYVLVLVTVVLRPRAGLYLVLLSAPIRGTLFLTEDGFSATRLLGLAVALGMVIHWIRGRRFPAVGRPVVPLLALTILAGTSIFPAPDVASAWAVAGLFQFVLLAVIVADVASRPRDAVQLCVVIGASALMTSLMMLGDYIPYALAARAMEPARFEWVVDPQSTLLATFFATGILALIVAWSDHIGRRWRIALIAMGVPMILALIVLTSRLALLALVVGAIAYALAGKGIRRRLPVAGGLLAAVVGLAVTTAALGLWDPGMRHRATHTFDSPYEATSGRTVIWRVGARVFAEHPGRGVGLSRFPQHFEEIRTSADPPLRSKPSRTPHSDFLGLAAEVGFLGPLLLLSALVMMGIPLIRRDVGILAPAALGWLVMLAGLMLGLDMLSQWQTWVGLGVVMGVGGGK